MRLIPLLSLLAVTAAAADTYRWVDENGVVTYSDRPHPGAEKVELESLSTYTPPTNFVVPPSPGGGAGAAAAGGGYEQFSISRPQPEETLWNLGGALDVYLSLTPSLQPGDSMRLLLDGQPVTGLPPGVTSMTIDRVFRGTHTLRAVIIGPAGNTVAETPTVRFYVRETSVLNPNYNTPNRPPARVVPPSQRPGGNQGGGSQGGG